MKVTFKLRFHTQFGQSLWLSGEHELLGGGTAEDALPLQYTDAGIWQLTIPAPTTALTTGAVSYRYILRNPDGSIVEDWGKDRVLKPAWFDSEELLVLDSWNYAGFFENVFYTEPFRKILLAPNRPAAPAPLEHGDIGPGRFTHIFRLRAPLLAKAQTLCLLGDHAALANWNTANPVLLHRSEGDDYFEVKLDLSQCRLPIAYKYGVFDLGSNRFIRYEDGSNRTMADAFAPRRKAIINDGFAVLPADTWKGAGVAIPVFSLRSEQSFGTGEFSDLKKMADWCQAAGLKLIQILPVNDTSATNTWLDSYPYAAISAFALHPLYLNLSEVVSSQSKGLLGAFEPERLRLNALPALDYEAVIRTKLAALKQIYPLEKDETFNQAEYRSFFKKNRQWLIPYAAFCVLRDQYGTNETARWPEHRRYRQREIARLAREDSSAHAELAFYYFVQFHLHRQLREATNYAHSKGVVLKGDIAIGVARDGADTWQAPELFHLEFQAGAPPDAFAAKGQNWSFPTYNWPRMKETGFAWWKQRFAQMSEYFDAFRIDHILGFFRIWSIPADAVEGILGRFVPAQPVRAEEFLQRGVPFEPERYTQPYITDAVLAEIFGTAHESVKDRFLKKELSGAYILRPEFATQKKVEARFAAMEMSPENARLKEGWFDLISNVILFETAPGQYHFRLALEQTTSFRHLDLDTRRRVAELQLDYFFRRQEEGWKAEALQKLPALKRVTNMLVCGEDLGMVPACVPGVMKDLGLLSLEVQRMPKDRHHEFSRPANAPYLSVVTPGTHDMSTLRGWWQEERQLTQRFYNQELRLQGEAPKQCEPWLNQAIIVQHLASPAMWSIFQLQDLLGMDAELRRTDPSEERINVPANPQNHWQYRMHLTLEQLLGAARFNQQLREMLQANGRT